MPPWTIENARAVYERTVVPRTGYNRFQKAILQKLCEEKGIYIRSTAVRSSNPTKDDYIRALLDRKAHDKEAEPKAVEEHIIEEALPLRDVVEQGPIRQGIPEEMDMDITESFPLGETYPPSPESPKHPGSIVRIRLYNRAKDWHHTREIDFQCNNDGGIDLLKLQKELEIGKLQVLEPRRRHPFFEYTPGILQAEDLEDLMYDNILLVTDRAIVHKQYGGYI